MARLIDADALLQSEVKRCGCVPLIGSGYNDEAGFKLILNLAPTVDAVEVVHGEWTVMENDYDCTTTLECSVCEMSFCFEEYDGLLPQAQTYHYCPNCGAKMDL